ncbi:17192_t:CDS:2 [Entrophospora sp. SA101]|nr:17192_t:CDS:2 [Entrophospora sp. SA101]
MLPLKNVATSLLSSSSSSSLSPRFVSSSSVNTEVYNHSIFDPVESEPSVQDNTQCPTQEVDPRSLLPGEFNRLLQLSSLQELNQLTDHQKYIDNDSVHFESSESNIDIRRFYYGENQIDYDNQYADNLFNFY